MSDFLHRSPMALTTFLFGSPGASKAEFPWELTCKGKFPAELTATSFQPHLSGQNFLMPAPETSEFPFPLTKSLGKPRLARDSHGSILFVNLCFSIKHTSGCFFFEFCLQKRTHRFRINLATILGLSDFPFRLT
jgi:hypothetical protein